MTDPSDLTMGDCDRGQNHPWRAPGSAPVGKPCGGRDMPPTARTSWKRGSIVEVAWSPDNNHGGGYAYRLCPAAEAQTEECFQRHHLPFADNVTTLRHISGSEVVFPHRVIAHGTTPAGSQWVRNPIPTTELGSCHPGYIPFPDPCSGCRGDLRDQNLVDRIEIPGALSSGDYTLSWRWDTELNPQVWLNCADVTIVDGPVPPSPPVPKPTPAPTPEPTPVPTPSPAPSPAPQHCNVGDSIRCPGSSTRCAGDQCCPDGSTCPSASSGFSGCGQPKREDCTQYLATLV